MYRGKSYRQTSWREIVFYYMDPLGIYGAHYIKDYHPQKSKGLENLFDWIDHSKSL
jgi:hypothetical protein